MSTPIKVGDCYTIPLPDGRYAYCQHVCWNEQMGYLIRIFDYITPEPLTSVSALASAGDLFPPVFVGLLASVKSGRWKHIGNLPVTNFSFPMFRATAATKPGTYESWWLWDGKTERFIGALPRELRSLEHWIVWGDSMLEERIATGKNPFVDVL